MQSLTLGFLHILIYPFRSKNLYVFFAGILLVTWLFNIFNDLIIGKYK